MALKSGLLCESTWALDVLSVLLYDDATILYFNLQHLPGLLNVLLEHFRRCLMHMFGNGDAAEIEDQPSTPSSKKEASVDRSDVPDTRWYVRGFQKESEGNAETEDDELRGLGVVSDTIDCGDKQMLLTGENFTYHTRRGKLVKALPRTDLFVSDDDRVWDTFEGSFDQGAEKWRWSSEDDTLYIQTHFENDVSGVSFVRIMEDVVRSHEAAGNEQDEQQQQQSDKLESVVAGLKEEKPEANGHDGEVVPTCDPSESSPSSTIVSAIEIKREPGDNTSCGNAFKTCDKSHSECATEANDSSPSSSCKTDGSFKDENAMADDGGQTTPFKITFRSPKRRLRMEDYEDEAYTRDEPSLCLLMDAQDSLARRCLCISNILRGLSFVPGNDTELSKSAQFLGLLGKLLLLHHRHSVRRPPHRNYDKEDETDVMSSCSSLNSEKEWWWDTLHHLRENTLVTLSNIAGQLDLSLYPEEVSLPILDGLLHWAVCPSAYAQDPLPTLSPQSVLSPHRLSLEALCKLSVQENNVDLLLATPPFSRIERLFTQLARSLGRHEEQVVREFAVILLHYLSQADSSVARAIALQNPCVSLLIAFVEQAEQSALNVANTHGIAVLRDNPEMMGTSLDMLRRTAHTLLCLARVPENRAIFMQHQHRLLQLVTSQILDQHVASIVADVLYECSQPATETS